MNFLQLKASNPEVSTWVSASAGTGKTKILTDRVLRLLLQGADFKKILCITFTNAAAGEMKERIASSLANWSTLSDTELQDDISSIIGRSPSRQEFCKAKQLYELYLRADEKINIQTIHSFCQTLLKKFPLEAGIAPNFKVIDENKSAFILQKIKKKLLNQPELELINDFLITNFHELIIDEILSEIIQNKTKFTTSTHDIYEESKQIIRSLEAANHDQYQLILQHPIVQNIVGFNISPEQLKAFFLNKDGQKRKRIVTQKIAKPGSSLYDNLEELQEQIYKLDQNERAVHLENYSKLLSLLSGAIIASYENYKISKGLLDYDDLITCANKLLTASDAKEWVLYKLDGGIDHLLVDEAQDTSFSQWQIIESIIEEFYSGESAAANKNRTIFVVGDEKQSIFSFQGADVESFTKMNNYLKQKMASGGKKFENVNLEISYRSAGEILDVVHEVFDNIQTKMPHLFTTPLLRLTPFRTKHKGSVEIWPLCISDSEDAGFWDIVTNDKNHNTDKAKTLLAQKISHYIKTELASARIVPSTGKTIAPSDFMILFRKRDELTDEVIKAIKDEAIAVEGLDRISLKENLAVQDLLSAAKFVLNTKDELNLAALLKSPLIGISEQELYDIAVSRKELSIWQYIQKNCGSLYAKLNQFIELFKETNLGTFFQYIVDIIGHRDNLNAHCGPASNDAIDELLYAASDFSNQENTSLQNFIFWLEGYNSSIKRDSSASDKVKIMTLHASKGLQAPFVILCDTSSTPTSSDRFLWDEKGRTLSAKNSNYVPDYYTELKEKQKQKAYAEYLRLLYVGMTRAEDHLIICGYQGGKALPENCWYELVRASMEKIAQPQDDGTLIYGKAETSCPEIENNQSSKISIDFFAPTKNNPITIKDKTETKPLQEQIPSPLSTRDPMGYGLVFHKILEDAINAKQLDMMQNHPLINTLGSALQNRMRVSIEKIIANHELRDLIKKEVRTEITIGSDLENKKQVSRLDLMIKNDNEIIIIDYKSDISPPSENQNIPDNYEKQLTFYKQIIGKIYNGYKIRTMILWLENGQLQEI
jgi:ATP-dependent helicase/nuclease subunit A